MPGGALLAAAGAGLGVAAILALKRRTAREWFAAGGTLPSPGTKPGEAPRTTTRGAAQYVLAQGNFVRGLDMQRRTGAGEISPHWGVDIAAPVGTAIYAVKGGTVVHASPISGYGETVQIDHGDGQSTLYGHLSRIRVRVGQSVVPGWRIGDVGATTHGPGGRPPDWAPGQAAAMGPHLHMEVHPWSRPRLGRTPRRLDPVAWLRSNGTAYARERWNR